MFLIYFLLISPHSILRFRHWGVIRKLLLVTAEADGICISWWGGGDCDRGCDLKPILCVEIEREVIIVLKSRVLLLVKCYDNKMVKLPGVFSCGGSFMHQTNKKNVGNKKC